MIRILKNNLGCCFLLLSWLSYGQEIICESQDYIEYTFSFTGGNYLYSSERGAYEVYEVIPIQSGTVLNTTYDYTYEVYVESYEPCDNFVGPNGEKCWQESGAYDPAVMNFSDPNAPYYINLDGLEITHEDFPTYANDLAAGKVDLTDNKLNLETRGNATIKVYLDKTFGGTFSLNIDKTNSCYFDHQTNQVLPCNNTKIFLQNNQYFANDASGYKPLGQYLVGTVYDDQVGTPENLQLSQQRPELGPHYAMAIRDESDAGINIVIPSEHNGFEVNGVALEITENGSTQIVEFNPITLPYTIFEPISGQEGDETFIKVNYLTNQCNTVWQQPSLLVSILPECEGDTPGISIEQGAVQINDGYGDPIDDGYEVLPEITYNINVAGVSNISDYEVLNTDGTFLNYTEQGNSFSVNSTKGWYSLLFTPKTTLAQQFCDHFVPFNIFVGGSNLVIEEPCLINLNQYLITAGYTNNLSLVSDFAATITSEVGIVIDPGITLENGAFLDIGIVDGDFVKKDADKDKPWVQSIAYDETGKVMGQSRQYFDDLGRANQSQVYSYAHANVITSEVFYDYKGRGVLSTLAAPSVGLSNISYEPGACPTTPEDKVRGHFNYKNGFVTTGTDPNEEQFDAQHFDESVTTAFLNTGTENTLGYYYGNNVEGVAPTNYPFSQQLFYEDGSGRVKSAVSPGDAYRENGNFEHIPEVDVEILLATNQDLIDYLHIRNNFVFPGTTVDYTENVFIEKVKDPNGIEAFEIKTKSGQTLVSSLPASGIRSMTFYNDKGQVVASITPNGMKQLEGGENESITTTATLVLYNSIDKTTYEYNHRGEVIAINEPDAGRSEYKYRRDGTLRYSQNAVQRTTGKFSYTNYDRTSRPIESGEYIPTGSGDNFADMGPLFLEKRGLDDGLDFGTKIEVVKTYYDLPVNNTENFEQNFVRGAVSSTEKVGESQTWYNYDDIGRVVSVLKNFKNMNDKYITMDYQYDAAGNVKEVGYNRGTTDAFYHVYTYDADQRLHQVYASKVEPTYTNKQLDYGINELQATYSYYQHGPLKRMELGENTQGVDFTYTVEGWLKAINDPYTDTDANGTFQPDVFGMSLDYYQGDYRTSQNTTHADAAFKDQYNGNITAQNWFKSDYLISGDSKPATVNTETYVYAYDERYQLSDALYGTRIGATMPSFNIANNTSFSTQNLSFDANGNMQGLVRKGADGVVMHDFANKFHYETPTTNTRKGLFTNQLTRVDGYADYTYDALGQLKEVSYVAGETIKLNYNVAGLVTDIRKANNDLIVEYQYDEAGQRTIKKNYQYDGAVVTTTEDWYVRDMSGTVVSIYRKETDGTVNQIEIPIYGAARLGQYQLSDNGIVYELKDHLGNVRAVVDREPNTSTGLVNPINIANYFPFGLKHSEAVLENYRYGYQGEYSEDETDETGFNSFQLRLYDPVIGRWISVDPYRQHASPYMAMGNNPVMYTDADGGCDNSNGPCDGTFSDGTHYHIDADGIFNTFNDDGSIGEFFNVPVIGIEKPSGISKVGSEISFYAGETWNWIKSLENINGRGVINWGSWGGDMSPIGGQSKRGYDNGSGLPGGLGTAGGNSKVDAVNKVTDAVKKALELADAIKGDGKPALVPSVPDTIQTHVIHMSGVHAGYEHTIVEGVDTSVVEVFFE